MNIKLINIKKVYSEIHRKITALDGIYLDINEGNYIAFVGPSGSGKTTLLSIIGGLIKPTEGDIYLGPKKVTKLPDYDWSNIRKEYIGFIFQKKLIIPHLTVEENIMLPLVYNKVNINKEEALERCHKLMEDFNLTEREKVYPYKLSGGELQRVIIARALISNPQILLADEPTGDLDINSSKYIIEIFKKLNNEQKVTIIMVTHNLELAKGAKIIYGLKNGKIDKIIKG